MHRIAFANVSTVKRQSACKLEDRVSMQQVCATHIAGQQPASAGLVCVGSARVQDAVVWNSIAQYMQPIDTAKLRCCSIVGRCDEPDVMAARHQELCFVKCQPGGATWGIRVVMQGRNDHTQRAHVDLDLLRLFENVDDKDSNADEDE